MRKRYFFWFTCAFLLGIVLAAREKPLVVLLPAAGIFLVSCILYRYGYTKVCLFTAAGLLWGAACFSWQFSSYHEKLETISGKTVTLSGRVEEVREGEENIRLLVRGRMVREGLSYADVGAYVYLPPSMRAAYGDRVTVSGEASVPRRAQNFGESDMRHYYMGQGVLAFLYPAEDAFAVLGTDISLFRPRDAANALQNAVWTCLSNHAGEAEGFLRAYLTGDAGLLSKEKSEALRAAGLSHIVAVSGMHLGVIVGAVMALFGVLKMRRRLFSVFFYLVFTWFFVLFTGASASVLRAALMLSVFFLADFFRRENDSLTALSFAAFALCLVNPGILFDMGFALSVSATLGILLFNKSFSERLAFLPKWCRTALSTSLAAFLGYAPVAMYYFGAVSMAGLLANVLVCPILAPLLILGFAACLLSFIPHLSDALFFLLECGVSYIELVARLMARLPFAVSAGKITVMSVAAYVFSVAAFYMGNVLRRPRAVWCLSIALFFGIGTLIQNIAAERYTKITFLSVGQGDAALVQRGGDTLLFDSGGSRHTDVAARTVLPYLRREGITKLRAAFLTHYHTDHAKGCLTLLQNGMVETLYLPPEDGSTLCEDILAEAHKSGTAVRYLADGDAVSIGESTVFAFCAEGAENGGLLYRLDTPGTRVLFTGDIEEEGEARLCYRGADIDCDILKVSHHGASGASCAPFLKAASPQISVISCGENQYGHPTDETLCKLGEAGGAVYRTDTNGAVSLYVFENGQIRARSYR